MGAIVKYRDLPGGPVDVRFGEEVSRHCLCTQCGMLSMHVYEDRNEHVFCGACIDERRCKNHTHIFCKYEQKNVSLGEMVKAKDVVTAMRDQYAFCPNKGCGSCVHLKALSEHYSGCIARVASTACLQNIETREWESNWQEYSPARHEEPTAMETDQTQWPVDNPSSMMTTAHQVNDADRPGYSYGSPERYQNYANPDAYRPATQGTPNTCDVITRTRSSSPENWKPQAPNCNHRDAREGEVQLTACDYCKRPVKEANLSRHIEVCLKAQTDCVYCGEYFPREDVAAHFKVCRENPGNVPQQNEELAQTKTLGEEMKLAPYEKKSITLPPPEPSLHLPKTRPPGHKSTQNGSLPCRERSDSQQTRSQSHLNGSEMWPDLHSAHLPVHSKSTQISVRAHSQSPSARSDVKPRRFLWSSLLK